MEPFKVYKQGIELEINIIEPTNPFNKYVELHEQAEKIFRKIYERVYFDDLKPEFPSLAYENLGDLSEHISQFMSLFIDKVETKDWKISLLGNFPYFYDFCSGHIHTSIVNKQADSWLEMRKKLFNAQPLIAYISANSPILQQIYRASDVRLAFSSWARFVDYNDRTEDHWCSLAKGERGETLECRLPSAGPLFQIIGIANILRTILESGEEVSPIHNCEEIFNNVVLYGSKAIVPIYLPYKVNCYGYSTKKIYVRIVDLFRMFIEENKDKLKEQLKYCPSKLRDDILDFYQLLAKGVTMSDIILYVWSQSRKEIVDFIHYLTKRSYSIERIIPTLPMPPPDINQVVPIEQEVLTLEEFKQLIETVNIEPLQCSEIDVLKYILYAAKKSEIEDILGLIRMNQYLTKDITRYHPLVEQLIELNVLKEEEDRIVPSSNFPIFIQLKEMELK
ncbi:MAG: hypothetical protein QXK24_00015 [Ignisphaera sp.]